MNNISDKGKTSWIHSEGNFRQWRLVGWLKTSWVCLARAFYTIHGWNEIPIGQGFGGKEELDTLQRTARSLWPQPSRALKHTLNFKHVCAAIEVSAATHMLKIKRMFGFAAGVEPESPALCRMEPRLASRSSAEITQQIPPCLQDLANSIYFSWPGKLKGEGEEGPGEGCVLFFNKK